jgi:hypothetical protein
VTNGLPSSTADLALLKTELKIKHHTTKKINKKINKNHKYTQNNTKKTNKNNTKHRKARKKKQIKTIPSLNKQYENI